MAMAGNNEKQNKNNILNSMSSSDLRDLLRFDIYSENAEELDPCYILKIMEVLEEKEKKDICDQHPDVNIAFQSFKESYLPYTNDAESLYDWDNEGKDTLSHSQNRQNPSKSRIKPRRFVRLKRLGIVAAVFIVFSTLFFSTTALGSSFWQSITQWSRETFGFSNRTTSAHINMELIGLHEALVEHGITELVAPSWIPEGFELIDLIVLELSDKILFMTQLENGNDFLLIQLTYLSHNDGVIYERNDEDVEIYRRNGIDHFILSNMDYLKVVWNNQNIECFFTGDITKGDAQLMINSIYER